MGLNEEQIERYSRQIVLKEVGGSGQEKLLAGRVLIIGAGGLGSPAGLYLAAAGVGTLGIVDGDLVELGNLQRQILHGTADVGNKKVDSAAARLRAINPDVNVRTYQVRIKAANIRQIIREYDFIIDGTDNFPGKFLINDACYFESIAFSHASVLGFDGQVMSVLPGESACYRCVLACPPPVGTVPSSSEVGILGVVPAVVGALEATEAIKFILGIGELLTNQMLIYDALTGNFRKVSVNRNPQCPLCGNNPSITKLIDQS